MTSKTEEGSALDRYFLSSPGEYVHQSLNGGSGVSAQLTTEGVAILEVSLDGGYSWWAVTPKCTKTNMRLEYLVGPCPPATINVPGATNARVRLVEVAPNGEPTKVNLRYGKD